MSAKNDSREKILTAATRLFHIQGYHATGLNQILKESGAPKGSLYYHFPNGKEQLAIEAVEVMALYIESDVKEHMAQFDDPVKGIHFHIKSIAKKFDDIENLKSLPVGLLAAETSLISEPMRKACQNTFKRWEQIYCNKLIETGYEPAFAEDISIVINCMIEGAITRSLTNKNGSPLYLIADSIQLLLRK
ncbi:TetR/AcrR family transcriptional regulator [Cytobacillus purgationiresistens]|uniref:TetR/AcrR family transcriptional repressor of lmrAB and yxaGH operons n=1 Tax=Cytobacillus purgationiresistens TaxID=863449 RepID=A0ABU0AK63_9BACI|nr:TetR/AcrR family transcriptional regulator [Cytobacillus purgationiresistens]MDQ0271648.1 TetR/AcrR family transcriptional repressor of lmrAB and yxaGH operons [Cytobacillus purgationiresistens]